MIYGHGDDSYKYTGIRYNFSSNTRPGGLYTGLVKHLRQHIEAAESYPEPMAQALAQRIEEVQGLAAGSVLVCNGAVEAFYLLAAWRQKSHSLVLSPSFSDYEDACRMYEHHLDFCSNTDLDLETVTYPDMFWMCNPNNPDGKVFEVPKIKAAVRQNPQTLFMLDEAYVDFIERKLSLEQWAPQQPNLVVVRSLTKRFSMPGLRLGYMVAHPDIIQRVSQKLIPWRINVLAQKAGWYCFADEYQDDFDLSAYLRESAAFKQGIQALEGFELVPSETPYFLVKTPMKAKVLKEYLARKHQILIRDASNFRGLDEHYIRLSTQCEEANRELIKALRQWS